MAHPDYPDVLGGVTTQRILLNEGKLHAAVAVNPEQAALGQPFEVIAILQNATDQPQNVKLELLLPHKDEAGQRLSFFTPRKTFEVKLDPLAVGLVYLPLSAQPPTPLNQSYPVQVSLAAHSPENAQLLRPATGGRDNIQWAISPIKLGVLRQIPFTVSEPLQTIFEIISAPLVNAVAPKDAHYEPLWTVDIWKNEQTAIEQFKQTALTFTQTITRQNATPILVPLIYDRFDRAGLPLLQGEGIMLSKIMSYVVEQGLLVEAGFSLERSRWFRQLCRWMAVDKVISQDLEYALDLLFSAILWDATMLAFKICQVELRANLPALPQLYHVADELEGAARSQVAVPLNHLYFPLMQAGILLNETMMLPLEALAQNLQLAEEALQQRRRQVRVEGYDEIFGSTHALLRRIRQGG